MKLKKIKLFFKKLPKTLAENSFFTVLGLLFLSFALGLFVFYKYSFLADKQKLEITEKPLEFEQETYVTVLKKWEERDENFSGIDAKIYSNPFKKVSTSTQTLTK